MVLHFLTHNLGWKLVSLAAAFAIWMEVASEPELATVVTVPVEYRGTPDDLEISSSIPENVTLEVQGPSGRLRDMRGTRAAVVLDLSTVHGSGEKTFDIDSHNVSLPPGIRLVRGIPPQLIFTFESRRVRDVPVEVRLSAPHQGYMVASAEAVPPKLRIVGPESVVRHTGSVQTDPVDIGGVVSDAQYQVNTYLPEKLARFQGSSHVTVRVVVKKK